MPDKKSKAEVGTPSVQVPADALYKVLMALSQPLGSPHIRELQATRNLPPLEGIEPNPINILVEAYNAWYEANKDKVDPINK